jgi:hypothetical protein
MDPARAAKCDRYLVEENRVLREQLGKRRVRLTDDQRRPHCGLAELVREGRVAMMGPILTTDRDFDGLARVLKIRLNQPRSGGT